jgi:UDP-N-acetylglucosamine--N-acetylmuramyl-(pentapeptide) pyrophosphoryl-undecaprenol N-acetylglucosamine transferase
MKTVIACGGTGGHLFPGLAVAEVLRARGHEVLIFISEKEIDSLAVSNRPEFRFEKLPTIGLPSPFSPAILRFTQRFNESLTLCRRIYRTFNPHVVLGWAGSPRRRRFLPAGCARSRRSSRIERHSRQSESPHRANDARGSAWLRGLREVFPKGADGSHRHPHSCGSKAPRARRSAPQLGLREDLRTLLVMGGSQGASGINQSMIKSLPRCKASRSRSSTFPARAMNASRRTIISARTSRVRRCVSSRDGGSLQRG